MSCVRECFMNNLQQFSNFYFLKYNYVPIQFKGLSQKVACSSTTEGHWWLSVPRPVTTVCQLWLDCNTRVSPGLSCPWLTGWPELISPMSCDRVSPLAVIQSELGQMVSIGTVRHALWTQSVPGLLSPFPTAIRQVTYCCAHMAAGFSTDAQVTIVHLHIYSSTRHYLFAGLSSSCRQSFWLYRHLS